MPRSSRTTLNWIGALILAAGLMAAAWIWIAQDRLDRQNNGQTTDNSSLLDDRKDIRQLQMISGDSGVVAEEGSEWLASLAHGKRLAATIAVLSSVLGIGCMLAADYLLPMLERGRMPPNR